MVRELLEMQERAFRQTIELYTSNVREEVSTLRRAVEDLKTSLAFSQKDINDTKEKIFQTEAKVHDLEDTLAQSENEIDLILDKQEYLENYSRRNNVKILGIQEKDRKDGNETWEECEEKAVEAIKTQLKITEDLKIERAHRVGKPRPQFRHVDGNRIANKPRPIFVRFHSWKVKEKVVQAARRIRPDGMKFFEDFSKRTLDRRKEMIPKLIKKRKEGKRVFLVMDKIVEYESHDPAEAD